MRNQTRLHGRQVLFQSRELATYCTSLGLHRICGHQSRSRRAHPCLLLHSSASFSLLYHSLCTCKYLDRCGTREVIKDGRRSGWGVTTSSAFAVPPPPFGRWVGFIPPRRNTERKRNVMQARLRLGGGFVHAVLPNPRRCPAMRLSPSSRPRRHDQAQMGIF
ncbi:hypothetical protein F4825DRAFT_318118 [Nemania diffusa]|nr:hypothetical protein F4825DRAFT_318118 [Nemania diffusa]